MEGKRVNTCRECSPGETGTVKCLMSAEQRAVVEDALAGHNVFLGGPAGSGKSVVLRHLVSALTGCGKTVGLVAPTGAAACQIGGQTIHSFGGIPPVDDSIETLANKACKKSALVWRATNVLIIDEISMVTPKLLAVIHATAYQAQTKRPLPKGPTVVPIKPLNGMQLIVCGDFFQLPPVNSETFCFESPVWQLCNFRCHILSHIYRQSDAVFQSLLLEIRDGKLTPGGRKMLSDLKRPLPDDPDIQPTVLKCHNSKVDEHNDSELEKLPGEERIYKLTVWRKAPPARSSHIPEVLRLRVGAQVMVTVNMLEHNLHNGSRGVVIGFDNGAPRVRFLDGSERTLVPHNWLFRDGSGVVIGRWTQIPLRLAWAITVHRAQGMSIDRLIVDLERAFAYHQTYVALSRARTMDGLQVLNWSERNCKPHPSVVKFMSSPATPP